MGLFKDFVSQTRKPEGLLGKMMLGGMNSGHAKLADWGFSHLPEMTPGRAVDLGCGGGRNAGELLKKYPKAHVTAVDYSALSVEKARDYNKAMIAAKRCKVLQGDVSDLQLPAEAFDLATAFETVYFWPGLEKCFSQVAKVLKPGGTFLICNESDGTDPVSLKYEKIIDGMKNYTAEEYNNMNKVTLKIDGMMCGMCEAHICDTIRKAVPSAKKVAASRSRKEASFLTEVAVDSGSLKAAIDATGYTCLGIDSAPYEKKGLFGRK